VAVDVSRLNPLRLDRLVTIGVAIALLTAFPRVSAGQLAPVREYEIKAGFLYNFATFVEWPDGVFKTKTEELRLEVIGHDPFDGALDRLVAGKTINQHPVVVVYSGHATAGPRGHMVFVSGSEYKQVAGLLSALNNTPTLTVSDIDRFAEHGGVIGLVAAGRSVRFVINTEAATRARLRVSSRLLSLATILKGDSAGSSGMTPHLLASPQ
jgi:hypothetical protein